MIHDFAAAQILGGNRLHFLLAQAEIPDIEIFLHSFHMDGLGND